MATETHVLLDPTSHPRSETVPLAPRPARLAGRRVALLDNAKPNAARLLDLVAEELARRAPDLRFGRFRKPNTMTPAPAELLARIGADCDLVVTATAD